MKFSSRYCEGCVDRVVGCHAKCFAYNVDLARYKEKNERVRRNMDERNDYIGYVTSIMGKTKNGRRYFKTREV